MFVFEGTDPKISSRFNYMYVEGEFNVLLNANTSDLVQNLVLIIFNEDNFVIYSKTSDSGHFLKMCPHQCYQLDCFRRRFQSADHFRCKSILISWPFSSLFSVDLSFSSSLSVDLSFLSSFSADLSSSSSFSVCVSSLSSLL